MGPFKFGRGGPGGWVILDEPELHAPAGDIVMLLGTWSENAIVRAEPFDAIELELGLLWER